MFCQEFQMFLCPIVNSSHTINIQFFNTFTALDLLIIRQIGLSSLDVDSGNLNAECAVLPPGGSISEIRDKATSILSSDLTLAKINLETNVLLVSFGGSKSLLFDRSVNQGFLGQDVPAVKTGWQLAWVDKRKQITWITPGMHWCYKIIYTLVPTESQSVSVI